MRVSSNSRRGIGRRTLLAGAGALVLPAPAVHAQTGNGVALVIGNSKYQWEAQLPNVKRDVPDVARRFQAYGLKTELVQDVGRDAMRSAVEKFTAASSGASLAAFYFAGHGVFQKDRTYLLPIDADLSSAKAMQTLPTAGSVGKAMKSAHSLMVLDNCRNNPADGWRQREAADMAGGLSEQSQGPNLPPNFLVIFSTAPGHIALDGPPGDNSPFAAALLREFSGPSVEISGLPARMRRDLLIATEGRQVLIERHNFSTPFQIAGKPEPARRSPGDPSRVLELTNAYAFARQNGLPVLPGLLAWRGSAGSRAAQKVGGYSINFGGRNPSVLMVLSEDQQGAELVFATRFKGGPGWRLIHGTISGNSLEFTPIDGGTRTVFKWSNANSGSVTVFPSSQGQGAVVSGTFTRVDG